MVSLVAPLAVSVVNGETISAFVKRGGFAAEKEFLDGIERRLRPFFAQTEAKGLCDRRIDTVKNCIHAHALDPFRTSVGIEPVCGLGKLRTGESFSLFQSP